MTLGIVIPSFRRMARQSTLGYLPPDWRERTTLVLDASDASLVPLYPLGGARVVVHPPDVDTIAKKRAWILRNWQLVSSSPRIVMFDDDLRFAVRIGDDSTKLRQATGEDIDKHLRGMDAELGNYIHSGWSMRQGNNTHKDLWGENGRVCYTLGYHAAEIVYLENRGCLELGRIRYREDMDLTLQLLRLGWSNRISYGIAADQVGGFGARGGCSDERTIEGSNEAAQELADLHPGLVKVVEKTYEGSINRKEVVVQWKKAYQEGLHSLVKTP